MKDLYGALKAYAASGAYPFHMPGHKRNLPLVDRACSIDITEIDGFDNLHHPEGFLKEAMEEAAALYGSRRTFFLVNGSSCGILAAVSALVPVGGKLLLGRNCHTSAYNALGLRQLRPVYLWPRVLPALGGLCGAVQALDVEAALQKDPEIRAVLIVSPTYEGIVSDIPAIAGVCHAHGVPLVVDEAHGAHFSFGQGCFPVSALAQGADVVIQSLHKTLPAMTQTAVLHIGLHALVSDEALARYTGLFQSTSPSYVLLASILACLNYMKEHAGEEMPRFAEKLQILRRELGQIPGLSLLGEEDTLGAGYDISKLVFSVAGMSGREAMVWLREQAGLELEMAAPNYALAMTSLCDTREGFDRLRTALRAIPKTGEQTAFPLWGVLPRTQTMCLPFVAQDAPARALPLREAVGGVAGETAYLYPPGIPVVLAGERVTEEIAACLGEAEARGFEVRGAEGRQPGTLRVLAEQEEMPCVRE